MTCIAKKLARTIPAHIYISAGFLSIVFQNSTDYTRHCVCSFHIFLHFLISIFSTTGEAHTVLACCTEQPVN